VIHARSRLVGAVAVPAAVALSVLLSACQAPQAGAAATVGEKRISVASVQSAYQQIEPLVGQDQQITQADILNLLILRPYLLAAAAREGNAVSTDAARDDIKATGATSASSLGPAAVDVWQSNLAFAAVQQNQSTTQIQSTFRQIGAELKKAGVRINPRYGSSLDYSTFAIKPEVPNWLPTVKASAAAPSAAPTAAPTAEPTAPSTAPTEAPTASPTATP
jgi:hypothetical protein